MKTRPGSRCLESLRLIKWELVSHLIMVTLGPFCELQSKHEGRFLKATLVLA